MGGNVGIIALENRWCRCCTSVSFIDFSMIQYELGGDMREEPNVGDKIRTAIFWAGIALIMTGVLALLGLATVAVDIIKDPEGVPLVKWLAEQANGNEFYLRGFFEESRFEFNFSPALQYIFLGIIGLFIISIFSVIVRGLISIGAQLLQVAGVQQTDKIEGGKPNRI